MTRPDDDPLVDALADRAAGRRPSADLDPFLRLTMEAAVLVDRTLASFGLAYHGHPNTAGQWRLLRPIGRGTAGMVYAAERAITGEPAAVRTLADPAEPWLREAAHRLIGWHDPAVGAVLEVDRGWIAMEWIAGPSLASVLGRLRREPPLDREEYARPLLRAMAPVAAALRVARERDLIHGGIRPSKLALDAEGRFRLRDFGFDPTRASRPPSATAPPLGSPLHLAPEQAGGGGEVGPLADLYSFCAVLYTIAAGTPPFLGRSLEELLRSIRTTKVRSLATLAPWLPEALRSRIERGLSKRPEDRIVGLRRLVDHLSSL